jgi:hypothetical protein
MESIKVKDTSNEAKAFYRQMLMPEEDRLLHSPGTARPGYRWFRSENVVAIEHFRKPHTPEQRAGRFGWVNGQ